MSNSVLAAIITPAVVIVALAVWLGLVYRAQRHPASGRSAAPLNRDVVGGAFKSTGGRQLMPRRDATPAEARPRSEGCED